MISSNVLLNIAFGYGLLVPLVPVFGSGPLLVLSLLFVVLNFQCIKFRLIAPAIPFLAVIGSWLICYGYYLLPIEGVTALFQWHGIYGLYLWIFQPGGIFSLSLVSFIRYALFFTLIAIFIKNSDIGERFLDGLMVGMFVSCVIFSVKILELTSFAFPNENDFWSSLERMPGTFSDPNAAGIFIALAIPFIVDRITRVSGWKHCFYYLFLGGFVVCGLYTGSRSFFLALIGYLAILAYRTSKRLTLALVIVGVGVIITLIYWSQTYPDNYHQLVNYFPPTVERILSSINPSSLNNSLTGRLLFNRVSWEIFVANPFFGTGFENYRFIFSHFAERLGIDLSNWTDNNNNFYLGLLAETGLVGFVSLIYFFSKQQFTFTFQPATISFILLSVLMVIGPHLSFDEVMVFASLIVAKLVTYKPNQLSSRSFVWYFVFSVIVLVFVARSSAGKDLGFFPREGATKEEQFSWTSVVARKVFRCSTEETAFYIRAIHPDITSTVVKVDVISPVESKELVISGTDKIKIDVRCSSGEELGNLQLTVQRPWSPLLSGFSADSRILGVQFFE